MNSQITIDLTNLIWWSQILVNVIILPLVGFVWKNWRLVRTNQQEVQTAKQEVQKVTNGELEKKLLIVHQQIRNEFAGIIKDLVDQRNAQQNRIEERLMYLERIKMEETSN